MTYDKPSLTVEQQADRLLGRGLVADRAVLVQRLTSVNYYRLSGYLHTFRQLDETGKRLDDYYPGTLFETVWDRYRFDRQLRLLVLDGIERFEVSFKTLLTLEFTQRFGPFGYLDPRNLPRCDASEFAGLLKKTADEISRSKEDFVKHFRTQYGDHHTFLPLWAAVEIMTFGTVMTLFQGMRESDVKPVAQYYGLPLPVLVSWVKTLNTVRNICAHHSRLWNRELGVKPVQLRPDSGPRDLGPVPVTTHRVFAVLSILKFLLDRIAPQSGWPDRLKGLLAQHPTVPRDFMGFPEEWEGQGVWR